MRLSKVLDLFLDDCRTRKLADATLSSYEGNLRHLIALATVLSEDNLSGFTEELVAAYFAANVKKGNVVATLITKRAAVVEFARFCQRKRYLLLDPTVNMPRYRLPYRLPRPYTSGECARLLALTTTEKEVERRVAGKRVRAWTTIPMPSVEVMIRGLLYLAGLRVGTVCRLRIGDIEAGQGDTLGKITVITKGDRQIQVPIVPELARLLSDYMIEHTDLRPKSFLLSRRHGLPWTVRMVQRAVTGWGRAAGVPNATSHRFRHTAGKEFLETGATLEETQGFLGHANIATTQVYRRVTNQAVADAALRRAQTVRPESTPNATP